MLRYLNKIQKASLLLIALVVLVVSCKKAVVNFGEEALTDDPNVTFLDTLTVELSTFQVDSFVTSGDTLFKVGIHTDSIFGRYEATAYMQVGSPTSNPLNSATNVTFDSLVFITRFSGATYGDTTESFQLNVHRLSQQMQPDLTAIGYNVDSFNYDPAPVGSVTLTNTRAYQERQLTVRLQDAFGQELFGMMKRNSDTITDASKFYRYFNGFALKGKGAGDNSIYYFKNYDNTNGVVMKMYYTVNGSTPTHTSLNFSITPSSFQFNGYKYDKTGTYLSIFTPKKREIYSSAQTGQRVYLHGNSGLYPRLYFPTLFNIKELHPYVKVIKASLIIQPSLMNYGPNTYYKLPPYLGLYSLNEDKNYGAPVYDPATLSSSPMIETGNLYIDYINHTNTNYSYDLTVYVNDILKNGIFSQNSLVLFPLNTTVENRLVLEDAIGNKAVKLKLYVLGL